MPGDSPTKQQAQAYSFGVRRVESAVATGDPLLLDDGRRRRLSMSLIISFVLAGLLCAAFAVYGLVRPAPQIGNAAVVIDSDSGAVFVSRGGLLYPAMNLSSALLAAGRGQGGDGKPSVKTVDNAAIAGRARGPLLGIPGAPTSLPARSTLLNPLWTVCDTAAVDQQVPSGSPPAISTTAIIGLAPPSRGALETDDALLVSPDRGATTYLVWQGHRARLDPSDDTIRLAFGAAATSTARPISTALLNIIPQSPALAVPKIDTGGPTPAYAKALGVQVGEVFALDRADGDESDYVAMPDGVQLITPLVADLIRDEFDVVKKIPLVAPRLLRQAPRTAHRIALADYPATRPGLISVARDPVICIHRAGDSTTTTVLALSNNPLPAQAKTVRVTRAAASTVDSVYLAPGSGAVFSAATTTQRTDYLITDDGVAYPIATTAALTSLGYTSAGVRRTAPELIGLLPRGATLDPAQAARFYPETGPSAALLPTAAPAGSAPHS